ncbi:MAG: potassium transporter TrkH [Deltaproteobacteria bacterium]|jgi:trk system potassium uptake protein TrkH|nr:potassium transporter TrkH [Deltaproteobacteria bacterium]
MKVKDYISRTGFDGALLALSPMPLYFAFLGTSGIPSLWRLLLGSIASLSCFICSLTIFKNPKIGKILGAFTAVASLATGFPFVSTDPYAAFLGAIGLISIAFLLFDLKVDAEVDKKDKPGRRLQKAWWAFFTVILITGFVFLLETPLQHSSIYIILSSYLIAQIIFARWALKTGNNIYQLIPLFGILAVVSAINFSSTRNIPGIILVFHLVGLLLLPRDKKILEKKEHWWEILLNHPARIMLTTFLFLCASGSLLLILPFATTAGAISVVDAIFTSVSAVCVTGLIVLDTPREFTFTGQVFIILLIQLGGLGIMSITTVALHKLGRRLSLKQERVLTQMTDTDHKDLVHSLATILKFTFAAEAIGALLLIYLFYGSGDSIHTAVGRGIFTAISAFCNAGFAMQSDSLVSYQTNPYILHIVSTLIIFGGIAPATSLLIPRWISGKSIPIPATIALLTTIILLVSGTVLIFAFEYNGVLSGLSLGDKIQNAWFQSATLRTAGFNSVGMAQITSPTFLIIISFMFIGGSPGGTAGGIKTTTLGVLAMTFWANVTNKDEVIIKNRRIHHSSIFQAVTVIASGFIFWFVAVMMIEITQDIPSRDGLFEATSALGTVGLSTGATGLLDEIGKIIIIITMFVGRIGPITLFMLLSDDKTPPPSKCPDTKISLT